MATEVLMPRQGQSVESCLIVGWKKQEGETVAVGDILCEVETDKATFEVEAPAAGVLLRILHQADAEVPVLAPIAYIGEAGETVDAPAGSSPSAAADAPASSAPAPAGAPTAEGETAKPKSDAETASSSEAASVTAAASSAPTAADTAGGERFISPRARRRAEEAGVDWNRLSGSGPDGRIIERDIEAALAAGAPPTRTAAAQAAGAPIPAAGSGIGGRVRVQDLGTPGSATATTAADPAGLPGFPGPATSTPVKGVRKVIAERMMNSLQNTAQLTLNASADARALQRMRARLKASPEELGLRGVTINDLVHFAVARTLPMHGFMNAHMSGGVHTSDATITTFSHVHLGFAVDTPKGLMVPTIRFADRLSLREMAVEAKRLAAACQSGSAGPDDLAAGTFTVTNLGGLGVESFTPVLNPPQVGILGVSTIQLKPIQAGDEVEFIPSIGLSLTIDHRAVDGAPAARFLQALSAAIADVDLLPAL